MASFQVDASPVEDVITETEATSKEPQEVTPPPVEPVQTLQDLKDEEGPEEFAAPPYQGKVEDLDDDDEDEYAVFMDRQEAAAPPLRSPGEPPATFGDPDDEDDEPEDDEDDA